MLHNDLFTIKQLASFKKEYNKAIKSNKKIFKWNGVDVLVSYAKYLILYYTKYNKSNKIKQ